MKTFQMILFDIDLWLTNFLFDIELYLKLNTSFLFIFSKIIPMGNNSLLKDLKLEICYDINIYPCNLA